MFLTVVYLKKKYVLAGKRINQTSLYFFLTTHFCTQSGTKS